MFSPGRSAEAAHAVQKKNADNCRSRVSIGHRSGGNRVVRLAVGKHIGVVLEIRFERFRPERIDRDRLCCRIVGIGPHQLRQSTAELSLLLLIELFVVDPNASLAQ